MEVHGMVKAAVTLIQSHGERMMFHEMVEVVEALAANVVDVDATQAPNEAANVRAKLLALKTAAAVLRL